MRYFIIALFSFFALTAGVNAQTDVPSSVTAAFKSKFPNAQHLRWDKEDARTFEAEFTMNGHKMSALFDRTGTWKETETRINKDALPDAVVSAISKKFSGFKLENIERIENEKGNTSYEVELEKKNRSIEVVFDKNGKVLKQKAEEENDHDESDED